ncbi:hypothetical protein HY251_04620 [bacterium]|nr:hypothetical protein [bacterium]
MSAQPLLCTSCGASLQPRVLETKVKCTYCETVFTIVRDRDGITGLSSDGAPSKVPGAPAGAAPAQPVLSSEEQAAIDRLERDAALAVRGLEAVANTAYTARRMGCLNVLLVLLIFLIFFLTVA